MIRKKIFLLAVVGLLAPIWCHADQGSMLTLISQAQTNEAINYSLNTKVLLLIGFVTLLPALLMSVTSFLRIYIVLSILRQGIGIPNVPNQQILVGLSLLLSLFVMAPVAREINTQAIQPYLNHTLSPSAAITTGLDPLKHFMQKQIRTDDLNLFLQLAQKEECTNDDMAQLSLPIVIAAFMTSELKTAFQMGFLILIPFLLIDLVVASILTALGMIMLSPTLVALPFKLLLFIMANGWILIIGTLSSSFIG